MPPGREPGREARICGLRATLACFGLDPMEHPSTQRLRIAIDAAPSVSALLRVPDDAWAGYVFAHGAGAGMAHGFMASFADGLAERGIATLRYQFPYMEQGSKRPDVPKVAHAAVRAAVAEAAQRLPGLPLFAGGKSFGGRMTSQAQALAPLPGVRGLVFVGFPLHPAGKPADDARRAPVRDRMPDAVPAGHARRTGGAGAAAAARAAPRRRAGDAGAVRRRRPFVPRPRPQRPHRRADAGRDARRDGRLGARAQPLAARQRQAGDLRRCWTTAPAPARSRALQPCNVAQTRDLVGTLAAAGPSALDFAARSQPTPKKRQPLWRGGQALQPCQVAASNMSPCRCMPRRPTPEIWRRWSAGTGTPCHCSSGKA